LIEEVNNEIKEIESLIDKNSQYEDYL